MRLTRIAVVTCAAVAVVACGIDAVGLRETDGTTEPPTTDASPSGEASVGTIEEDAAIGVPEEDGGGDGALVDAGPDAPPITTVLELKHAVAPAAVNLTTEGSIDWAYWGANGVMSPVRKTAPNVISSLAVVYVELGATLNGFGTTFSWTNGTSVAGSSDGYLYVKGGAGVSESFTVPSGPVTRTVAFWVGGNDIRGKLSVSLADGGTTLTKTDASYESQGGTFTVQYTIEYRTVLPSQLEVKWELDQPYGVNSARFAAVALR